MVLFVGGFEITAPPAGDEVVAQRLGLTAEVEVQCVRELAPVDAPDVPTDAVVSGGLEGADDGRALAPVSVTSAPVFTRKPSISIVEARPPTRSQRSTSSVR